MSVRGLLLWCSDKASCLWDVPMAAFWADTVTYCGSDLTQLWIDWGYEQNHLKYILLFYFISSAFWIEISILEEEQMCVCVCIYIYSLYPSANRSIDTDIQILI